jgi:hypothetical protein
MANEFVARKGIISNGAVTFNSTLYVGVGFTCTGAATASSFNLITALASTAPAALGVAAVGTSTTVARADHVHLLPTLATLGAVGGSGTTNQIPYWSNTTTLGSLSTATYPSLTELSYVKGVTGSIQTSLNGAVLITGDQTKTGILTMTNTTSPQTTGIVLTNNSVYGAYVFQVSNGATGTGMQSYNSGGGVGMRSDNVGASPSIGAYFYNNDTGRNIVINNSTASTGIPFTISKNGVDKLTVTDGGEVRAIGDVIAFYTSDERLKDNKLLIPNALAKLKQISGYEFDWNDKQNSYTGHDVGVIAQEIEKVLPELVITRDNGYKAVKYEKIVALLIEAIKEQQIEIEELKTHFIVQ